LEDAIRVRQLAKINIKYATYELAYSKRKRRKERMEEAAQNNQANTEAAIAAAQAKSEGEIRLEQVKSQLKIEQDISEINKQKEVELLKYTSILKSNVASAIMQKEGSTVDDLPSWVTDGIGIVDRSSEQIMMDELQDQAEQEQMEQEAMAQEQMAAQQQMAPEEQMMA